MGRDLHLAGKHEFKNILKYFFYACKNILNQLWNLSAAYYLNLRFQYTILGIDMDNELLAALRNVMYEMVLDPKIASLCLQEVY